MASRCGHIAVLLAAKPAMANGVPVTITIETRSGAIAARVWQLAVGRTLLLLLDSNVEGNRPEDRHLTARLYGEFYHADGVRRDLRNVFVKNASYEGLAWLYDKQPYI